jgi:hypothetical protein
MNTYVHFNKEHNVLICKVHQCVVSSKFLYRHFLNEHDLDLKVRQAIITYASQFSTAEPSQILYSPEKIVPVPYLSIITGFQCQYKRCDKVLGTLTSVKHHCKVDHDWKAKDGTKWAETRAQTLFQGNDKRDVN